ncbi:hypothetical protein ACQ4N7_04000 [Nodosilinea sp. AN01ver1]|uniref:hypothetical protein n=1 Tax=Nodosilinea sp. AN01ver1 TaxID=3423362 RepID=UPI003D31F49B
MKNQAHKTWNSEQLVQMSDALGGGYVPGMQASKSANGDRWTAQRHIQVSALMGQAYL